MPTMHHLLWTQSRDMPAFRELLFWWKIHKVVGFAGGAGGKEHACQCRRWKRCRFGLWVGKVP